MGTADNRARADTGRLRPAIAVPAVERNRAKCRSQLLQAVGGYRCDIYGNHVSFRLHPLFPVTNARPVWLFVALLSTTSQAKENSMNALLLSPHIPSTGRGSLTTSAAISLRSRWSRPRRRLSLKSAADIPNAKAGFRLTFLQGPLPSASTNSRSRASDRRNTRKRIPRSGRSSYSAMLVFPGRVASERPSGKRRQLGKP